MVKISVIIPSIGRETLHLVLKSLDKQAIYQVIVVLSGNEAPLPTKWGKNYPWVRFVIFSEKLSAAQARNVALAKANGDIIAFLGDDTVPKENWAVVLQDFYTNNAQKEVVLLGNTAWSKDLAQDDFHRWLLRGVQFDFPEKNGELPKKNAWKHFYTSNIALRRNFLGDFRFDEGFSGWGFEDIELGYRLSQKNMKLFYKKELLVEHFHTHTLKDVLEKTKQSISNAEYFENTHPAVKMRPKGIKKNVLGLLVFVLGYYFRFFSFPKRLFWWFQWKKDWLGNRFTNVAKNTEIKPKEYKKEF